MARERVATRRAQPVLKWAGGKQGIARRLVEMFPRDFERYYEPFVGGASVLFALEPERAVAGDANGWLIDTYRALEEDPGEVARLLDGMENTKEEYLSGPIRKFLDGPHYSGGCG